MKEMTVGEIKVRFSEVLEQVKHGETFGILYGRKKESIAVIVPFVAPHGLQLLWQ